MVKQMFGPASFKEKWFKKAVQTVVGEGRQKKAMQVIKRYCEKVLQRVEYE